MNKCRTDNPSYHQTPDWDYEEIPEAKLNQMADEWFTFGEADEGWVSLLCAIDNLTQDEEKLKEAFTEIMLAIQNGKLNTLKKEMIPYIKADIEAGNI